MHCSGELVRQYWDVLLSIQKADLAQEIYVRQVSISMQAVLGQYASKSRPTVQWLPSWHSAVLQYIGSESEWLLSVLPQQHPALLLQALAVTLKAFARCVPVRLVYLGHLTGGEFDSVNITDRSP